MSQNDDRSNDRVTVPIRIRFWSEDSGSSEPASVPSAPVEPSREPVSSKGSERRMAVRVPRAVEIEFWIEGTSQKGRVEDLSETGLFVSTTHFYEQGNPIRFRFELPDGQESEPIEGEGTVVWTEQIGFAIQFEDLDPETTERLRSFIEAEVAAVRAHDPAALKPLG
ncbi:MAG: PilZ domain-containing protein [Acidobacteriota bacterium]|nr:PilZ domain-containing protein [Acidobacteriota bacterium]